MIIFNKNIGSNHISTTNSSPFEVFTSAQTFTKNSKLNSDNSNGKENKSPIKKLNSKNKKYLKSLGFQLK